MAGNTDTTLTDKDLAVLLRDGHPALDANIARNALEQVVAEWENDPEKSEYLEALRNSPLGVDDVVPEIKWDYETEEFYLGPNKSPGTLYQFKPAGEFAVADKFTRDYFEAHRDKYRELLEKSSLTKKQFMVYVMKNAKKKEHEIAYNLDMKEGTVRSHAGRARRKVEEAQHTAQIPELFTFEGYDELQENMSSLLEPTESSETTA